MFGDIETNAEITRKRIEKAKKSFKNTKYCKAVFESYDKFKMLEAKAEKYDYELSKKLITERDFKNT